MCAFLFVIVNMFISRRISYDTGVTWQPYELFSNNSIKMLITAVHSEINGGASLAT